MLYVNGGGFRGHMGKSLNEPRQTINRKFNNDCFRHYQQCVRLVVQANGGRQGSLKGKDSEIPLTDMLRMESLLGGLS